MIENSKGSEMPPATVKVCLISDDEPDPGCSLAHNREGFAAIRCLELQSQETCQVTVNADLPLSISRNPTVFAVAFSSFTPRSISAHSSSRNSGDVDPLLSISNVSRAFSSLPLCSNHLGDSGTKNKATASKTGTTKRGSDSWQFPSSFGCSCQRWHQTCYQYSPSMQRVCSFCWYKQRKLNGSTLCNHHAL